jgi:prevent-host-death family protein
MNVTTITSRDLHQNIGRAKKAALNGPVFITDHGKPGHVLLSMAEYQRLTKQRRNIADALAMPGLEDLEFKPQRLSIQLRPADI